jgi:hypothetical protein
MNSPKSISKILHSLTPLPLKTPAPGTLHSPAPIELVTPMDRYARWWMSFLQTNVCTSERTAHAPSLMLQVAGRGYAELLTAGCIDTGLPAGQRYFGQSDKPLVETANVHHGRWVMFTETRCENSDSTHLGKKGKH